MTQNISVAASVNNSVINNSANYKPFNLEDALNGKPVVTRDGKKVKVVCKTKDKILVHIYNKISYMDMNVKMNLDGSRFSPNLTHNLDLMMA